MAAGSGTANEGGPAAASKGAKGTTAGGGGKKTYGLSTRTALARLHEEIDKILHDYERKYAEESFYHKLRSAFVKRYESPLGWFAIASSLLTTIALLVTDSYATGLLLAAILLLDLFVVVRENNLRRTEMFRKTKRHVLDELRLAEQELCADWAPMNYPHLWCPMSPCVSLQWTYRDGVIVNLPWALLVRGDHIVLRPGHATPGPCSEVDGRKNFSTHEIYGVAQVMDPPLKPAARSPLQNLVCCLQSTPFLENLHLMLERSHPRPPTIYNQQRYLLISKYIQQWGFICALVVTFLAGVLRLNGVGDVGVTSESHTHDELHYWKYLLIEAPAAAVMPLLPLVFPLMWISMNLWGVARLQCFLKTPQTLIGKDSDKSFDEDLDTPTFDYEHVVLQRAQVLANWLELWQGDSELLPRSSNVVQVLGSITALCCVDKKGILSWPNPTAEKIFFLHDKEHDERRRDRRNTSQSTLNTESDVAPHVAGEKESGIVAEVLDLTHDQHCPFRLEFDDHEWKAHIKSLKPLGLAILLNTCSPLTHAHYAQFCGHVTAVAMLDKDLVPVTNRYAHIESSLSSFLHGRCLCELAKQIGFTDHATDRFALQGQLASYRHLQPDVVRRDIRFARQLQLSTKVKVPFPHSLSVVMSESPGGYLLFTQGTADIILDFCDDFWDGKDLRPLSLQDRKRALDFYQRSALTAYCTAFAYRPLRHSIQGALSGGAHGQSDAQIAYLELPPESKIRMQHVDKIHCDFEGGGLSIGGGVGISSIGGIGSGGGGSAANAKLPHSCSTDSLLFSDAHRDEDISDVENCFEMQCHQVFIGMVTMQYQAQMDIVQLVERLDRACIRFVHFSKENELRSRVFSEKMGLESGWNCHISLLSETEEEKAAAASPTKAAAKREHNTTTTTTTTITINPAPSKGNATNTTTPSTTMTTTTTTTTGTTGTGNMPISIRNMNNNNSKNLTTAIGTTTTRTTATTTTTPSTASTTNIVPSSNGEPCITITHTNSPTTRAPTTTTTTTTTPTTTMTANNSVTAPAPPSSAGSTVASASGAGSPTDSATKTIETYLTGSNRGVGGGGGDGEGEGRGVHHDDTEQDLLMLPLTNLEATKALSSSAPGAISNQDYNALLAAGHSGDSSPLEGGRQPAGQAPLATSSADASLAGSQNSLTALDGAATTLTMTESPPLRPPRQTRSTTATATAPAITTTTPAGAAGQHRHSNDSAMMDDDNNCRSLSNLTESTEQSAPIHFDMSNRAKLPRGIENIRPHLEKVDNVPLQVSLFTDCSAEATREMLDIMQSYGEIVVCMGSAASNANAEIFLQADCSIAIEPLYPQVCQDLPAYTEANIYNNKLRLLRARARAAKDVDGLMGNGSGGGGGGGDGGDDPTDRFRYDLNEELLLEGGCGGARPMQSLGHTVSPITLSRALNSLPCSISVCRDDSLSLVAIIELSRRFSAGLWNCIQYWACCAGSLALINVLCACLSLPPIVTPLLALYLMSVPVPLVALSLAHIDADRAIIMNRATGKKQTEYDTRVLGFVVWCYGSKFFMPILMTLLTYCAFMAHPIEILDVDDEQPHINLRLARVLMLPGILLHFVLISMSFVHRDHSLWQRNPLRNRIWLFVCVCALLLHGVIALLQVCLDEEVFESSGEVWPAIAFLYGSSVLSLLVTEIAKWQEIKVNTRYQRRARLDFGTKLGMNSPF